MSKSPTTVVINVDATQLDAALEKMHVLLAYQERLNQLTTPIAPAAVVATGLVMAGQPRRLSRRALLGLGWRTR